MQLTPILVTTATSIVLLLSPGCGNKDEKGATKGEPTAGKTTSKAAGGCDRRANEKLCGEYHGVAKTDWVKKECPNYKSASFVPECPKEGAVGRCVSEKGTGMETHTVYYEPMTKETVAAMCAGPNQEVRAP